jgi:hypothetical protein
VCLNIHAPYSLKLLSSLSEGHRPVTQVAASTSDVQRAAIGIGPGVQPPGMHMYT